MSKLTEADLPALRRLVEFCHEGNFVYPALPAGILDRLAPAAEAATGEPTDTHVIRCESGDEITVPDWNAAQARVLAGPGEPTDAELEQRFAKWWADEGSGIAPSDGEEHCFHAERVARIAWLNGAFVAQDAAARVRWAEMRGE